MPFQDIGSAFNSNIASVPLASLLKSKSVLVWYTCTTNAVHEKGSMLKVTSLPFV